MWNYFFVISPSDINLFSTLGEGSAQLSPPSPPPSEFCTDERQECKQISDGCLEKLIKIITLPTVTVLFLFPFINLILDDTTFYGQGDVGTNNQQLKETIRITAPIYILTG
jgi:hypothetical protein